MAQFMTHRPVPVDRLEKSSRRRDLDVIGTGQVECAITADAQIGTGRTDQCLGLRQEKVFGQRRWRRRGLSGKTLALVGVEDSEALEERDCLRFFSLFRGAA